ncbi:MAG: hypothetical protein WKG07_18395 [Hymenobacter sp.]
MRTARAAAAHHRWPGERAGARPPRGKGMDYVQVGRPAHARSPSSTARRRRNRPARARSTARCPARRACCRGPRPRPAAAASATTATGRRAGWPSW